MSFRDANDDTESFLDMMDGMALISFRDAKDGAPLDSFRVLVDDDELPDSFRFPYVDGAEISLLAKDGAVAEDSLREASTDPAFGPRLDRPVVVVVVPDVVGALLTVIARGFVLRTGAVVDVDDDAVVEEVAPTDAPPDVFRNDGVAAVTPVPDPVPGPVPVTGTVDFVRRCTGNTGALVPVDTTPATPWPCVLPMTSREEDGGYRLLASFVTAGVRVRAGGCPVALSAERGRDDDVDAVAVVLPVVRAAVIALVVVAVVGEAGGGVAAAVEVAVAVAVAGGRREAGLRDRRGGEFVNLRGEERRGAVRREGSGG